MTTRFLALPIAFILLTAGCAAPEPQSPPIEVKPGLPAAPMPRAVEDTRVYRDYFERGSYPADWEEAWKTLGVEWTVKVGVRRLVSTGRDVIDFEWSMKYTGPRPPLIIRKPSLTDSLPWETEVHVYAFPPGKEGGRRVIFAPPRDEGLLSRVLFNGAPADWWVVVKEGETETGRETLAVADVKERLRTLYPAEFPADKPPKLYVEFFHKPEDRGRRGKLDAWTGELSSNIRRVPDLKSW